MLIGFNIGTVPTAQHDSSIADQTKFIAKLI